MRTSYFNRRLFGLSFMASFAAGPIPLCAQPLPANQQPIAVITALRDYQQLPKLQNTVDNALALAKQLQPYGYRIIFITDAASELVAQRTLGIQPPKKGIHEVVVVRTQADLKVQMDRCSKLFAPAARVPVGLLIFSGHGVMVNGDHYFQTLECDGKVKIGFNFRDLQKTAWEEKWPVAFVVDTCRVPAMPGQGKGIGGVNAVDFPTTLWSTLPGNPAADSPGDLLKQLADGLSPQGGTFKALNHTFINPTEMLKPIQGRKQLTLESWFLYGTLGLLKDSQMKQSGILSHGERIALPSVIAQLAGNQAVKQGNRVLPAAIAGDDLLPMANSNLNNAGVNGIKAELLDQNLSHIRIIREMGSTRGSHVTIPVTLPETIRANPNGQNFLLIEAYSDSTDIRCQIHVRNGDLPGERAYLNQDWKNTLYAIPQGKLVHILVPFATKNLAEDWTQLAFATSPDGNVKLWNPGSSFVIRRMTLVNKDVVDQVNLAPKPLKTNILASWVPTPQSDEEAKTGLSIMMPARSGSAKPQMVFKPLEQGTAQSSVTGGFIQPVYIAEKDKLLLLPGSSGQATQATVTLTGYQGDEILFSYSTKLKAGDARPISVPRSKAGVLTRLTVSSDGKAFSLNGIEITPGNSK